MSAPSTPLVTSVPRRKPEPPPEPPQDRFEPSRWSGPVGRLAAAGLMSHVASLSFSSGLLQDLTGMVTYGAAYAGAGLAAVGLFQGKSSTVRRPLPTRVANGLGMATALNLVALHACFKLTGRRPIYLGLPAVGLSILTMGASSVAGFASLLRNDS